MAKYQQPNMANLMKQAQKMQEEMAKAQAELANTEYVGTAGGEAVKITLTGEKKAVSVVIDEELLNPEDSEMLCDMLVAAFNDGVEKADCDAAGKLGSLTGGMKLPGM